MIRPVLLTCISCLFALISPGILPLEASNSPRLFGEGVISAAADDLSPAFTPDGKTLFFTRGNNSSSMIMISTLAGGRWSTPKIAEFSGEWLDLEPSMSPEGSFLVFVSNRPPSGGAPLDGFFNGKTSPGKGGNLWRVDRTAAGWGTPRRLPDTINASTSVFSPSVTSDGSIYFMRPDPHTGNFHLFRSQYRGGMYLEALPVGVGDATTEDVDPAVAPDERFMIYSSNHPGSAHEPKRLKIVFRKGDCWTTPMDLGDEVNEAGSNIEARLGADHRTLYFSTNTVPPVSFPRSQEQARRNLYEMEVWANGRENIWYVSLEPWLDDRGK
jgi:dipeptidyl aminopeptidase/acylaminoacyl peptidase